MAVQMIHESYGKTLSDKSGNHVLKVLMWLYLKLFDGKECLHFTVSICTPARS